MALLWGLWRSDRPELDGLLSWSRQMVAARAAGVARLRR